MFTQKKWELKHSIFGSWWWWLNLLWVNSIIYFHWYVYTLRWKEISANTISNNILSNHNIVLYDCSRRSFFMVLGYYFEVQISSMEMEDENSLLYLNKMWSNYDQINDHRGSINMLNLGSFSFLSISNCGLDIGAKWVILILTKSCTSQGVQIKNHVCSQHILDLPYTQVFFVKSSNTCTIAMIKIQSANMYTLRNTFIYSH